MMHLHHDDSDRMRAQKRCSIAKGFRTHDWSRSGANALLASFYGKAAVYLGLEGIGWFGKAYRLHAAALR